MCGIVGFSWKDEKLANSMLSCIKYRGPDASGFFVDDSASFGHARLSILDLSDRGAQPMIIDDLVIVYNGEVFNFKEVRELLPEYTFVSDSDTEVILRAFQRWGPDCLSKFNGMFAFCIYNKTTKEFFLARDRFGVKPLYYSIDKRGLAFASEIKALSKVVKPVIDAVGFSQFFTLRFTVGETTMLEGVKKLLPGHFLKFSLNNKKAEFVKWYDLKISKSSESFDDAAKNIQALLAKSVERRMVSDVPVACFLSGGIDSSIITRLAKNHNNKLNTFSIGFDTTNELPFAKRASKVIKTKHREFLLKKSDVLKYLDKMVYHMDEPIGDPGFLPIFVLSKEVKKHNSVVLSGDGGDEVFCGYNRYKLLKHGLWLRHFAFFDFGNDILRRIKNMRGKSNCAAFIEGIRLFDSDELSRLGVKEFNAESFWTDTNDVVKSAQLFDIKTLLPNDFFMKADKMSSAFGLEQRVPFMDFELVEKAFSLPTKYMLRGKTEKAILRAACKDLLPQDIIKRKKHGFDVPIDFWFKNVLNDLLRKLLTNSKHGLYKKDYVLELLDKAKSQGSNYQLNFILAQKLWSILVFELWFKGL